jgi:dTDP-glucose 4,6-dehydratase
MSEANLLAGDLDQILMRTEDLWEELRGKRLFITGGTGFFGCWLLESFAWANQRLNLNAEVMVLTRNPESFRRKAPHLAVHPAIQFHVGDARSFAFPAGKFSHVVHLATEASVKLNRERPQEMLETIVEGTRHTLDFAIACGASKFLLASSGAVYGPQPAELSHISEDYRGAPNPLDLASAYGEGKRMAEFLCALYYKNHGLDTRIARCFAFVGPHLPLDIHFAIGNFIRDGLRGGPIEIKGDGTPYRSYLYAADLAIWLWTILFHGESCRAYNVGSETAFQISDVARMVAEYFGPGVRVHLGGKPVHGPLPERYVPSIRRAEEELGLRQEIDLKESIKRTAIWHLATVTGN